MNRGFSAIVLILAACFGCADQPKFVSERTILVFPQPENTFEEDVSARKPYSSPPAWLYNPNKYPYKLTGYSYFVGIGLPKTTLPDARDSAFEDAQRQIVRYMGTTVGVRSERTGRAVGDTRGGGYETVTEQVFSTAAAKHTVSSLYVRDQYFTAGMLVQNIAKRPVHLAYVLVEFGPPEARRIADKAKATAETEIKQLEKKKQTNPEKVLESRDQIRLDSLKRLHKKLDNLSADDFKL